MFLAHVIFVWMVFPVKRKSEKKKDPGEIVVNMSYWVGFFSAKKTSREQLGWTSYAHLSRAQPFQGLLLFEVADGGGEEPQMVVGGGYHQKHQHLYTWTFLSGVSTGCTGVGMKQPFRVSTPPVGECWKWLVPFWCPFGQGWGLTWYQGTCWQFLAVDMENPT